MTPKQLDKANGCLGAVLFMMLLVIGIITMIAVDASNGRIGQ